MSSTSFSGALNDGAHRPFWDCSTESPQIPSQRGGADAVARSGKRSRAVESILFLQGVVFDSFGSIWKAMVCGRAPIGRESGNELFRALLPLDSKQIQQKDNNETLTLFKCLRSSGLSPSHCFAIKLFEMHISLMRAIWLVQNCLTAAGLYSEKHLSPSPKIGEMASIETEKWSTTSRAHMIRGGFRIWAIAPNSFTHCARVWP